MLASILLIALSSAAPAPTVQTDITVTGDDRVVCPGASPAPRPGCGSPDLPHPFPVDPGGRRRRAAGDPNATIDGAADMLEMIGEKVSTGCGEGDGNHNGPLGPR